ncbi:hypothetical protein ABZU25_26330 [Micromonospora sp. NPDC005215]|uniref:hypothetical protein n=1 Tax=Micromonospora sp. NPDC005215 TaxID=3157024 RepID=UPI0033B85DD6
MRVLRQLQPGLTAFCLVANPAAGMAGAAYNRQLMNLIASHRADPSFLVSHELTLDEAPTGYQNFDARNDGWTKVLLHPDGRR